MEDLGFIRKTLQDVLVPEMQGMKERMAGHHEKFASLDRRLEEMNQTLIAVRSAIERIDSRFERMESRLQVAEIDKRLYRVELLLEHRAGSGSKSDPAA